jgi:hypothetical protein
MANIGIWIAANLVSLACVVGAVFLAYHGKEGWGWLLVVAIGLHTTLND